MQAFFNFFIASYQEATVWQIVLEALVFVCGILSVWLAKKEHIGVYPIGLIATLITVYLLYQAKYLGDMMMNVYYSEMSIYGWWNWARKHQGKPKLIISRTTLSEKKIGILLCVITIAVTYGVYRLFQVPMQTANYIDLVTSGLFFTAMWFMARKKIENWTLWIIADCITVPLYLYRGLGMLALQYFVFTILAIQGYLAWRKQLQHAAH